MSNAREKAVMRFWAAQDAQQIAELNLVWSPADTLADTRYRYVDLDGESHILFHREVSGFLTGLEAKR